MIGKDCRGCFLGGVQEVCVQRPFEEFLTEMAALRLDSSFSVHFDRGRFFEQGFDNSGFEVWWYKTRSQ